MAHDVQHTGLQKKVRKLVWNRASDIAEIQELL